MDSSLSVDEFNSHPPEISPSAITISVIALSGVYFNILDSLMRLSLYISNHPMLLSWLVGLPGNGTY